MGKEKLLVTSNFSFSNSISERLVQQTCKHLPASERVKRHCCIWQRIVHVLQRYDYNAGKTASSQAKDTNFTLLVTYYLSILGLRRWKNRGSCYNRETIDLIEKKILTFFTLYFLGEEERLQLTATKMVDSFFSPKTSRQSGFKRDLLVIVDSSGSISRVDFDMAKTQLGRILSNICPQDDPFSNDIHKAALLRFSNTPVEIFDFNANQNTQELIESLDKMAYSGGSTCTGDAFNYALNVLLKPSKGEIYREYVYSVAVYQKYLTRLGKLIIFEPWREKLSFLRAELDIFDIRQHYVRILVIFQRLIC